ncbi:MAG: cell division protein FtsQ/DivIB [Actinomycetota bacterium]
MKLLKLLLIMAVGGGLVYGGIQLLNSPALSLKTIELTGATQEKVTVAEVTAAGRISKGRNLLEISTTGTARRIETIPWIQSAKVERIYPSKIRIEVALRTPAIVAVAASTPFIVDREGVVLEKGEAGLVHLLEMPLESLGPGDRIKLDQFVHSMRIFASLPPELREKLVVIRAPSLDRITLELTEGTRIIYGAAERLTAKNYSARRLLERYDGQGKILTSIDVRAPSRPAVLVRP